MTHDFGVNKDFNLLLNETAEDLQTRFKYSSEAAAALVEDYLKKFTDEDFCAEINIPVQNEDVFFHESAIGLALRVHYYLGMHADPNPVMFMNWRADYFRRLRNG